MNNFKDTIDVKGFGKCVNINKKGKNLLSKYLIKYNILLPQNIEKFFNAIAFNVEASNKYGNLFLPLWLNKNTGIRGWYNETKSDMLFYLFLEQKQLIIMKIKGLRKAVSKKKFAEKAQHKYDKHKQADITYGLCVPISYLEKNGATSVTLNK